MAEDVKKNEEIVPKKKTGLIIVMLSVLLVLAIIVVVFFIFPKFQQTKGSTNDSTQVKESEKKEENQLGQIYKISGLTVNPKGTMGRRFAVFDVALEYQKPKVNDELTKYQPLIMDRLIKYLRNKTVTELSQKDQMDNMRKDLIKMINKILKEDAITNLYFTRYILE